MSVFGIILTTAEVGVAALAAPTPGATVSIDASMTNFLSGLLAKMKQ